MDALQKAVLETYVYVSASDGDFAAPELERFVEWARDQPAFEAIAPSELAAQFGDIAAGFQRDFSAAEARALQAAAAVKDTEGATDLVLAAAGIAVVADGELQEVEETAVDRVSRALGVAPSNR